MTQPTIDYYYPANPADGVSGGGAMSDNTIPRGSLANLFPNVSGTERTDGIIRRRKFFPKKTAGTATLVKAFLDRLSTAGDRFQIKAGGYEDTDVLADDIGWTTTVTWTLGTRQIVLGAAEPEVAVGELLLFTEPGGDFRGLATVATWTNTTTMTISTMIRGADPVTGDTVRSFWIGSGDLNTALTGGVDDEIIADCEVAEGIYVGMYVALVDWDESPRTVEYGLVTAISWGGTQATITISAPCASSHAVKTQGAVEGSEAENFDLDGLTLLISINGGAYQTITFGDDGMSAPDAVDFINLTLSGGTAYIYDTDKVGIRTDSYYAENSIQLSAASTALTELGLDSTIHNGTTGTVVCGALELGTLAASHSTPAKTSPLGAFTNNIVDYDVGAIYDDWVVLFTSATTFTVTGTRTGLIDSGTISAAFHMANPGNGAYYFEIPISCWGGTWAATDHVDFTTYPSAKGVWARETVPALTDAAALNRAHLSIHASW